MIGRELPYNNKEHNKRTAARENRQNRILYIYNFMDTINKEDKQLATNRAEAIKICRDYLKLDYILSIFKDNHGAPASVDKSNKSK
jgi:hypothetical protein